MEFNTDNKVGFCLIEYNSIVALVVQRTEQQTSNLQIWVRFPARVLYSLCTNDFLSLLNGGGSWHRAQYSGKFRWLGLQHRSPVRSSGQPLCLFRPHDEILKLRDQTRRRFGM